MERWEIVEESIQEKIAKDVFKSEENGKLNKCIIQWQI